MSQVKVTLVVNLETDNGKSLTVVQTQNAKDDLEDAIRNRIFGEGVFDPNVIVDTYTIDSSYLA